MSPKLELEFIKRLLTDTVYNEEIRNDFFEKNMFPTSKQIIDIIQKPVDQTRNEGADWPDRAHTMIGMKRLNSLHANLDYIRENKIEGDFIETGVWRGGASIFMAYYNKLYKMNRTVFVCDSFEGLPKPDIEKYPVDKDDEHYTVDFLKVGIEEVVNNFKMYGLFYSENIHFAKGWFSETLPSMIDNLHIKKISLLRFDGDMYGSTMDVLENLYPRVNSKGVVIIDDYGLPNCARAVNDFRLKYNIDNPIEIIDKYGIYWHKETLPYLVDNYIQKNMTEVDICIVSYAKTEELYEVTCKGIKSLLASEKDIQFNVFIMESNVHRDYSQFSNVKTFYPGTEFKYNKYLNNLQQEGESEYLALCNSDLTYEKGWATEIIKRMYQVPEILSASPFCPQTQNINDWQGSKNFLGYRVRRELAGWCIFQQRKIYDIIGKLNEDVDFWFSDDIYAEQLKKHNIIHALIPASRVNHHENNLGITGQSVLTEWQRDDFTVGQHNKFLKAKEKLWNT